MPPAANATQKNTCSQNEAVVIVKRAPSHEYQEIGH